MRNGWEDKCYGDFWPVSLMTATIRKEFMRLRDIRDRDGTRAILGIGSLGICRGRGVSQSVQGQRPRSDTVRTAAVTLFPIREDHAREFHGQKPRSSARTQQLELR